MPRCASAVGSTHTCLSPQPRKWCRIRWQHRCPPLNGHQVTVALGCSSCCPSGASDRRSLTCFHCDTGADRYTRLALEHAYPIGSPWETGPQQSAAPRVTFAPFLQRSLTSIGYHHTICYGFITLRDLCHYQPLRRYSLKVQARTSAGVNSSIALIPEEDHDEQDEQDETTDDALHERAAGHRWSGVRGTDSKCR